MSDQEKWIDQLKIEDLLSRYAQTLDGKNPEGWAGTFALDGEFVLGDITIVGRKKLAAIARVLNHHVGTRHICTAPRYEVDASGQVATGEISMLTVIATGKGYRIFAAGRYIDTLKKVDGEWLISKRRTVHEILPQDPALSVESADPIVADVMRPVLEGVRKIAESP